MLQILIIASVKKFPGLIVVIALFLQHCSTLILISQQPASLSALKGSVLKSMIASKTCSSIPSEVTVVFSGLQGAVPAVHVGVISLIAVLV